MIRRFNSKAGVARLAALAIVIGTGVLMLAVLDHRPPQRSHCEPLRIGISPWPGYELAPLAQRLGYFTAEGIDVRLVEFSSLSDTRRAFERGQVDGFFGTMQDLVTSRELGHRDPRVVRLIDSSCGGDVIIGSELTPDLQSLAGARVALEPGSINEFVLVCALEKQGLTLADIVSIPLAQTDMESAMRQGLVDAAVSYPPVSFDLTRNDEFPIIFSTAEIPNQVLDVLAIDAQVIQRNKVGVLKFLNAFEKGVQYSRDQSDDAVAMMSARTGAVPSEFSRSLRDEIKVYDESQQAALIRSGLALKTFLRHVQLSNQPQHVHNSDRLFLTREDLTP